MRSAVKRNKSKSIPMAAAFVIPMHKICLCGAIVAALLFLPYPAHAYSYYETERVPLGSVIGRYSLELWHHSGGYWQVNSGAGKLIKVRDRLIEQAGIVGYLNATQVAKWSLALPENVRTALKEGRKVTAEAEKNADLYVGASCTISGTGSVDVYAIPRFHVATSATLNSFVPGISVTIPLVSSGYGRNIYAIYGLRCAGDPGLGWFSNAQPAKVLEPYIHPSLITNKLGWLKSGATINIRGEAVSTKGLTIGLLTLAKGGAVGLHFDFPIKVNFFEEVQRLVTVDDDQNQAEITEDDQLNVLAEDGVGEEQLPLEDDNGENETDSENKDPADDKDSSTDSNGQTEGDNDDGQSRTDGPAAEQQQPSPADPDDQPDDPPPAPQNDPPPAPQNDPPPPSFDPNDWLIHRMF